MGTATDAAHLKLSKPVTLEVNFSNFDCNCQIVTISDSETSQ